MNGGTKKELNGTAEPAADATSEATVDEQSQLNICGVPADQHMQEANGVSVAPSPSTSSSTPSTSSSTGAPTRSFSTSSSSSPPSSSSRSFSASSLPSMDALRSVLVRGRRGIHSNTSRLTSSSTASLAASAAATADARSTSPTPSSPSSPSSRRRSLIHPSHHNRLRSDSPPWFPTPSPAFLAARAPLPKALSGSRSIDGAVPQPLKDREPVISVAPMVDVSDRHFRSLIRMLSKRVVLYSPMIIDNALMHAPYAHALYTHHDASEHPLIAQLGGFDGRTLIEAAKRCQQQGFQAVNINVGCPAPSAIGHAYGACLMASEGFPLALKALTSCPDIHIPITVKCRIGLNTDDSYEFFRQFVVEKCYKIGGISRFIVHARKAILGLKSAGRNLTVPPLNYEYVYRLKREYPHLHIELNGGVHTIDEMKQHLEHGVDGIMVGRAAWKSPFFLSKVDQELFGDNTRPIRTRKEVAEEYLEYAEREWQQNQREIREYQAKQSLHQTSSEAEDSKDTAPDGSPSINPPQLPPWPLDPRSLLKPLGYLYAGQPGYRHFRLLFEEGMLRLARTHPDGVDEYDEEWTMRHVVERAMKAVEPPPARGRKWKEEELVHEPQEHKEQQQQSGYQQSAGSASSSYYQREPERRQYAVSSS